MRNDRLADVDAAASAAEKQQSSVTERVGRGALRVFYQLWYTYRLGGTADENFRRLWRSAGLAAQHRAAE